MKNDITFFKAYLGALDSYRFDIEKFKRFFKDKRLSQFEKKLLEAYLLLRKNSNTKIIELLQNLTSENTFFSAQQELLLGLAYNNMANSKKAISYFGQAITLYKSINEKHYIFFPYYNLLLAYSNLGRKGDYIKVFEEFKIIKCENSIMHMGYLRCLSIYHIYKNEDVLALKALNNAFDVISKENKPYESFLVIDKFILLFKLKRYQECEELIDKYNKLRTFKNSANFHFMKVLLANFMHDTPIYFNQSIFKGVNILEYQMSVIKNLAYSDSDSAQIWWSKLHELEPHTFGLNFKYRGEENLFSACLKKYIGNIISSNLEELKNLKGSQTEKLLKIIKVSKTSLTKGELISLLWPHEEYSLALEHRFDALLYRTKKQYKLAVSKSKGRYKLSG